MRRPRGVFCDFTAYIETETSQLPYRSKSIGLNFISCFSFRNLNIISAKNANKKKGLHMTQWAKCSLLATLGGCVGSGGIPLESHRPFEERGSAQAVTSSCPAAGWEETQRAGRTGHSRVAP